MAVASVLANVEYGQSSCLHLKNEGSCRLGFLSLNPFLEY
jgi:hypothetical protein